MVTIRDVAKHAEVSIHTVSRVLNNDPTVRPGNRRLVLQAIAELRFVPNAAARSLRSARSNTIGFVIADLRNQPLQETVVGVEGVVRERGYSLLICDSGWDEATQSTNVRRLYERRVEGLLLYPAGDSCPELQLFAQARIPVVVISTGRVTFGFPHIHLDQGTGLRAAFEYLYGLGHRRIALLAAPIQPAVARVGEYRAALDALGLDFDPALVLYYTGDRPFVRAVSALLDGRDRPTAMISGGSTLTPFALQGIREAGLALPRDLSFVTLGDSLWASVCTPALTAVALDRVAAGRQAADYLFGRLAGEEMSELLRDVPGELVIRDSCAAPAA